VYLKVLNIDNNTNKVTIITLQAGVLERQLQWNLQRPAIKLSFNARDSNELNKARNDIVSATENSVDLISVPEDISREDICVDLVDQSINLFNRLDITINNAGISGQKKVQLK